MRNAASVRKEKQQRNHPTIFDPRYYHLKELRRIMIRMIAKNVAVMHKGILVDYGCGSMPYKALFRPYVKQYLGADIPENVTADIRIIDGRLDLPDASADLVLSTQVLEHVTDPVLYLKESFRVLKKDGLLILSTHGIWRYHPDPTDYWRWTGAGLKKILTDEGFQVNNVYGVMGLSAMGLLLFQDAFIYKLPKFLHYLFVPFMQIQMVLFDKIHSRANKVNDSGVFVLVAQKK